MTEKKVLIPDVYTADEAIAYENGWQAAKESSRKQVEELQARIAMQDEELKEVKTLLVASMHETRPRKEYEDEIVAINDVISANSEDVAAWQEKRDKEVAAKALEEAAEAAPDDCSEQYIRMRAAELKEK